jgi:cytochrome c biogenesis protein CcmG, thiol:disulfide interchange protein DsbE
MPLRSALLLVGLASILPGCLGPPPPSAPSALLAKPMPDVRRRSLDGDEVDTAGARGRVVVVDFFAKFCEPCKRTLPALQALHVADPQVFILGVAEDDDESDARELVGTFGLTFKVVQDTGHVLSGRFRVKELPMTFVSGPDGVMRWVSPEQVSGGDLERAVAAARRPEPRAQ